MRNYVGCPLGSLHTNKKEGKIIHEAARRETAFVSLWMLGCIHAACAPRVRRPVSHDVRMMEQRPDRYVWKCERGKYYTTETETGQRRDDQGEERAEEGGGGEDWIGVSSHNRTLMTVGSRWQLRANFLCWRENRERKGREREGCGCVYSYVHQPRNSHHIPLRRRYVAAATWLR